MPNFRKVLKSLGILKRGMDLNKYINKKVRIILTNGFTYVGRVLTADENSITIIDKRNLEVSLSEKVIVLIDELEESDSSKNKYINKNGRREV